MTLAVLAEAAAKRHLAVRAAFHPGVRDKAPQGCRTLVLLGPDEPQFWPAFKISPEFQDQAPDPLDRWSKRQAGALAKAVGAEAVYPSDGPPYPPFISWALASGAVWQSPVGLLVHAQSGLFVSFRAALALPDRLDIGEGTRSPCLGCNAPCLTACPVAALSDQGYDVARCKAHVASDAGVDCRNGCLVRRVCPPASRFGRDAEQSAFHMAAFLGTRFPSE